MLKEVRKLVFYESYFSDFISQQSNTVRRKINFVLFIITTAERIPARFFKHLEGTDGLYEIRVEFQGNAYRIFCCFDKGKVVVLFNAFHKKSQKTPYSEIDKALKIKSRYFIEQSKAL